MKVWRLMTHHIDPKQALAWSRQNERIAIGWGYVGDIGKKNYRSAHDISAEISKLIREGVHPYKNAGQGGACLWNFYAAMQKGDLVILNTKHGPSLVMEVKGDYEWKPEEPGLPFYQHQRRAQVSLWNPRELWRLAGARPAKNQTIRWTLIQCANPLSELDQ